MNLPTFMNSPLAWGALAFCIPLILHILNRSRYKRIEWGAMHLLESVVKVNHRRFQIEQLLLLLVRCTIPALLAFTLAKPVLTGAQAPAGKSPVSLAILLDTSYSMSAVDGDSTRFAEAIDAACAVVEAAPRGSEISVIQTGGAATLLFDRPVFDAKAVVRRLRTLQADFGASDMQQSLDTGMATLAGMTHARRELIIVSDFQPADWQSGNPAASVQQQVAAMSVKPELTLLQIGREAKDNVSVDSMEFSKRPLGVGQQLAIRANLRNHGNTSRDRIRVILTVDGAEQSVTQVALAASASTQTLFTCEFDSPGSHIIKVKLTVDDSLQADNQYAAAVTVWDTIDVLLVDGQPSSEPLKSETDFLSVALTPYTFGRMKLSDLVQTRTVSYKSNLKNEFESRPQVVVLANVPRLTEAQANELRDYVDSGGAVLICAGSQIESKWYNKSLHRQRDLLPAEFGQPKGQFDEQGQSARILAQHFDHPALQFFNEPANGDLSAAEIRQWFELKVPNSQLTEIDGESTGASQSSPRRLPPGINPNSHQSHFASSMATVIAFRTASLNNSLLAVPDERLPATSLPIVLAQLDNGDPLLVEKKFGDGSVIQLATACDADWSDLPMRPFYVPLMQQLVTTMATQLTPPRNIMTGEPAVALFAGPKPESPDPAVIDTQDLQLTTPTGFRRTVRTSLQGNRIMARFDSTTRPGAYSLQTPDAETIHFVANTSRSESELGLLDQKQIASLAATMGANVVKSPAQYLEQDRLRRNGWEIWRYVLAALLAFLFLELLLQQRFSRVRT